MKSILNLYTNPYAHIDSSICGIYISPHIDSSICGIYISRIRMHVYGHIDSRKSICELVSTAGSVLFLKKVSTPQSNLFLKKVSTSWSNLFLKKYRLRGRY